MTVPRPRAPRDKRSTIRFNKVSRVRTASEDFAAVDCVARNISTDGMLIETITPPPLGSEIRVSFEMPDSQASIVARAEVKNHYVFNYCEDGVLRWARGMGVGFVEFVEDAEEALRLSLTRCR